MGQLGLFTAEGRTSGTGRHCGFEGYLRNRGATYIAVDEAKVDICAGSTFEHFDYLVYTETGPNLLTLLVRPANITEAQIALLREWEEIFGCDFVGAFVWHDGEWVAVTLADYLSTGLARKQAVDLYL